MDKTYASALQYRCLDIAVNFTLIIVLNVFNYTAKNEINNKYMLSLL